MTLAVCALGDGLFDCGSPPPPPQLATKPATATVATRRHNSSVKQHLMIFPQTACCMLGCRPLRARLCKLDGSVRVSHIVNNCTARGYPTAPAKLGMALHAARLQRGTISAIARMQFRGCRNSSTFSGRRTTAMLDRFGHTSSERTMIGWQVVCLVDRHLSALLTHSPSRRPSDCS